MKPQERKSDGLTAELLQQFLGVQEQRAKAYNELRVAFSAYLQYQESTRFRLLLGKTTAVFQELSGTVRQIQEQLQAASRPDLATLLRGVQDHERSKLQYTMNLQALQQARRDVDQHEAHDCSDHAGHTCGPGPANKSELVLAISQCVQQLERVINEINEAVTEVRYELAEA